MNVIIVIASQIMLCHSYITGGCLQVKEAMNSIEVPEITRTPGTFMGAQFNFAELLQERIRRTVVSGKQLIRSYII